MAQFFWSDIYGTNRVFAILHTPEMSWIFRNSASELLLYHQGQLHPIDLHFYLQNGWIRDSIASLISLQLAVDRAG